MLLARLLITFNIVIAVNNLSCVPVYVCLFIMEATYADAASKQASMALIWFLQSGNCFGQASKVARLQAHQFFFQMMIQYKSPWNKELQVLLVCEWGQNYFHVHKCGLSYLCCTMLPLHTAWEVSWTRIGDWCTGQQVYSHCQCNCSFPLTLPPPPPSILQSPQMSSSIPLSTMSFSQRTLSKHQGHISSPLVSQDPWVLLSQSCRPRYQGIATSRLALRHMLWQRMVHCRLEDTHSILPCCISVGNRRLKLSVDMALLMSSLNVSISVLSCSITNFTIVKSWWFH